MLLTCIDVFDTMKCCAFTDDTHRTLMIVPIRYCLVTSYDILHFDLAFGNILFCYMPHIRPHSVLNLIHCCCCIVTMFEMLHSVHLCTCCCISTFCCYATYVRPLHDVVAVRRLCWKVCLVGVFTVMFALTSGGWVERVMHCHTHDGNQ